MIPSQDSIALRGWTWICKRLAQGTMQVLRNDRVSTQLCRCKADSGRKNRTTDKSTLQVCQVCCRKLARSCQSRSVPTAQCSKAEAVLAEASLSFPSATVSRLFRRVISGCVRLPATSQATRMFTDLPAYPEFILTSCWFVAVTRRDCSCRTAAKPSICRASCVCRQTQERRPLCTVTESLPYNRLQTLGSLRMRPGPSWASQSWLWTRTAVCVRPGNAAHTY